jgi:hypothetical protein
MSYALKSRGAVTHRYVDKTKKIASYKKGHSND